jgi:hypothetical protein
MTNNSYEVLRGADVYLGRTYGEWISEFFSWLFSVAPDTNNNGSVVFLRPFVSSPDPNYQGRIEPNLMVGNDKLQIFTDQALLIPVLLSYWASTDPNETETMLRERVRMDMINGDNLRDDQITIDSKSIELEADDSIGSHLIESPLFTLMVPDVEYGKSLKDYVDYPLTSGLNQSVGTGYFFLIRFHEEGLHVIHSYARGHTTEKGEYNEEFLYQIQVNNADKRPLPPQHGIISVAATKFILAKLNDKRAELSGGEYGDLKNIIINSRNQNKKAVLSNGKIWGAINTLKPDLSEAEPEEIGAFLGKFKALKPE